MRPFRPNKNHSELYGISVEQIMEWAGVSLTTARRWKRGEAPPKAAEIILELRSTGDLGILDPAWSGWKLRRGEIVAPDGVTYTPGQIMSTVYWMQLARHYQVKQRLPQQADWVDSEWTEAKEEKIRASGGDP